MHNAWKHEALDFTNWLTEEENLSLLSDEIGIDIKLIQTEATVGRFNIVTMTSHAIIPEYLINPLEAIL
jgi:hypothetical protein